VRAGGAVGEALGELLGPASDARGPSSWSAPRCSSRSSSAPSFLRGLSVGDRSAGGRAPASRAHRWAHYAEARRKEQLRREVIRKHTDGRRRPRAPSRCRPSWTRATSCWPRATTCSRTTTSWPRRRRPAAPVQRQIAFAPPAGRPRPSSRRWACRRGRAGARARRPARKAAARRRARVERRRRPQGGPPAAPEPARRPPPRRARPLAPVRARQTLQAKCIEFGVLGKVIDTTRARS